MSENSLTKEARVKAVPLYGHGAFAIFRLFDNETRPRRCCGHLAVCWFFSLQPVRHEWFQCFCTVRCYAATQPGYHEGSMAMTLPPETPLKDDRSSAYETAGINNDAIKVLGSRCLRPSNSPLKQECATCQSGAQALTQICFSDISRLSKVPLRARISFQYCRGPSRRRGFEWGYHKSASISFISMTASDA